MPNRETRGGERSPCPIASALDLLGDKWTLVVVRDLLVYGKRQYGEFAESPEGIPSNVLAERLRRLEAAGLVERSRYQDHPPRHRYDPTPAGKDLAPVLEALSGWGLKHMAGTRRAVTLPRRPTKR